MEWLLLTSQCPPSYTNAAYAASLKFEVGSGRGEGKHFFRTVRQITLAAGLQTRVEQKNLDVRATAKTSRGEFVCINISARSSSGSVGKRLCRDALSDFADKEVRGFFFGGRVGTLDGGQWSMPPVDDIRIDGSPLKPNQIMPLFKLQCWIIMHHWMATCAQVQKAEAIPGFEPGFRETAISKSRVITTTLYRREMRVSLNIFIQIIPQANLPEVWT
jgi:hypothetical protein